MRPSCYESVTLFHHIQRFALHLWLHVVCTGFFLGHARRLGHDDGAAMPHVLRLLLRSAACSKHGATDERLGTVWARQLHPSRATEPRDGATWWLRAAAKPHPNY